LDQPSAENRLIAVCILYHNVTNKWTDSRDNTRYLLPCLAQLKRGNNKVIVNADLKPSAASVRHRVPDSRRSTTDYLLRTNSSV